MIDINNAKKIFAPGMLVTWSSGKIRAIISQVNASDETVSVVLADTYHSPCGEVFPAGLKSRIPLAEIRLVH